MSGDTPLRARVPRDPLELQSALINRVLVGGVCITRPPTRFALSCGCNFSVRLEAIGCSRAHFPPDLRLGAGPFSRRVAELFSKSSHSCSKYNDLSAPLQEHRDSRGVEKRMGTATRHGRGPADEGWGGSAPSSQSTQIAQQNRCRRRARSAWGVVLYTTPPTSTRFGKAR